MDPISGLIALLIFMHMVKGLPGALANIAEALDDGSAPNQARMKTLSDAGIAPATKGGPVRRYLANLWREAWLAAEARRAAAAIRRAAAGRPPSRWQQRADEATAKWRDRHGRADGTGSGVFGGVAPVQEPGPAASAQDRDDPEVIHVEPATAGPAPTFTVPVDEPRPAIHAVATVGEPTDGDGGERVLVGAVVGGAALAVGAGEPQAPPAAGGTPLAVGPAGPAPALTATAAPVQTTAPAIEGTTTMSTAPAVTGVSSGAAAAAALAAAIQAATDEYVARLQAFQRQIAAMAEQAHGNVQLGTHSNVLANLAQAHEAASAAMGQAARVSGEVVPLMLAVRSSYLAIH